VGAGSSAGCGGSDDSSADASDAASDAGVEAAEQCPATVAATLGARCASEGLICAPEYSCALVQTPLECTCTHGVFVCLDVTGAVVPEGGTPGCPPPGDAGCPASEGEATGAACNEVGFICEYSSACGAGVDSCVCTLGDVVGAGPSFVFQCAPAACGTIDDAASATSDAAESGILPEAAAADGAGALPDATLDVAAEGSPDATVDAGANASLDATVEAGAGAEASAVADASSE
jgi:hypothetical protein